MTKYINADAFLLQYSILTSGPEFMPFSAEMSTWKLWKQEFDRSVQLLVSRMVTEREDDEQKFIAKIKEIPVAQIPIDDIVRCKDCKFYEKLSKDTDTKICSFWEAELGRQAICNFMPTDYCSYGERRESDDL